MFLSAEHATLGHFLVLSVLFGWVSHDVIVRLRIVLHTDKVCGIWRLNCDRVRLEILAGHVFQWEGADVRVWVLLTLGQVSDEAGDVFLELCQVHGHVVLIELGFFVVLLVTGDGKLESGLAELGDHGPDKVTDPDHLVLDVLNLVILGLNGRLALINLILQVSFGFLLLLAAHGVDLGVSLELLLDVAVLLLNQVDLTVEHVDVVEE